MICFQAGPDNAIIRMYKASVRVWRAWLEADVGMLSVCPVTSSTICCCSSCAAALSVVMSRPLSRFPLIILYHGKHGGPCHPQQQVQTGPLETSHCLCCCADTCSGHHLTNSFSTQRAAVSGFEAYLCCQVHHLHVVCHHPCCAGQWHVCYCRFAGCWLVS